MPRGRPRKNRIEQPALFANDEQPKKKRGRPRKNPIVATNESVINNVENPATEDSNEPPKKKRGRPKMADYREQLETNEDNIEKRTVEFQSIEASGLTRFNSEDTAKHIIKKFGEKIKKGSSLFLWAYKDIGVVGKMDTDEIKNTYVWNIFNRKSFELLETLNGEKDYGNIVSNGISKNNIINEKSIRAYVEEKY